jgi:ankyrin repeat protein
MNDFGATALSCAAKYGHAHILQVLIDHGALVNAVGVLAANKKGVRLKLYIILSTSPVLLKHRLRKNFFCKF